MTDADDTLPFLPETTRQLRSLEEHRGYIAEDREDLIRLLERFNLVGIDAPERTYEDIRGDRIAVSRDGEGRYGIV